MALLLRGANLATPVILFRDSVGSPEERQIAEKYFPVYSLRSEIPPNSLVIPRYYVVPHPKELEDDVAYLGSRLINTTAQHRFIASMDYVHLLGDATPTTWFGSDIATAPEGEFIVKGETNSKKTKWTTLHANTRVGAILLGMELGQDTGLAGQRIAYRRYVQLKDYGKDEITGIPISHEFRVFYCDGQRLDYGYYWSNADPSVFPGGEYPELDADGLAFADEVAVKIKGNHNGPRFFAVDVALADESRYEPYWVCVEVNDGCQAGLSECDPEALYGGLRRALEV